MQLIKKNHIITCSE